jgi:glycosyltransferase involved in cell wall biosynthesis
MENNLKEKVQQSIENLKNKTSRIYFMVQDTKGNAKASVRYIYQLALSLKKSGYNAIILHEKNDYTGVESWLGSEYMESIPHKSIEKQNLEIAPEDFIILPELFGYVMEQIKNIPCGKIVLTQSYKYMLETLQPGQTWSQFGFFKCLTTTQKQKDYIEGVMKNVSVDILTPYISDVFEKRELPPMPIIGVHSREQSDTINLIKTFYLKFPQFRWFTFRDLRGLSEKEFANSLKECFLSVWIDRESGFGTYPLESMSAGVPVMGLIPDMLPEWMVEENGIWVDDITMLPDFVADFTQNWLEDNIKPELFENIQSTSGKFKNKEQFESKSLELFDSYIKTRVESLELQLSKLED